MHNYKITYKHNDNVKEGYGAMTKIKNDFDVMKDWFMKNVGLNAGNNISNDVGEYIIACGYKVLSVEWED